MKFHPAENFGDEVDKYNEWCEEPEVCSCGDEEWGACPKDTCMTDYYDNGGDLPASEEEYYGQAQA